MMKVRVIINCIALVFIVNAGIRDLKTYGQSRQQDILQERLNNHILEEDRKQVRSERIQESLVEQMSALHVQFAEMQAIAATNSRWLEAIGIAAAVLVTKEIFQLISNRRQKNGS